MYEFTDIHSHILSGVDDGAKDADMSLKMLKQAEKDGISRILLTPHNKPMRHNPSPSTLKKLADCLQAELDKNGMQIRLYLGSELYYRSGLVELLDQKKVCTMADSSYILVEFNPMDDFDYIRNGIYQLMAGGYRPILAHTERYSKICAAFVHAEELVKMGCCIQINAGSIMGEYGYQTRHFARRMLKHRLVHFVATDAHDDRMRKPALGECARFIGRKYGEEYAEKLLYGNPLKVFGNEFIND